jgi:hypothetical protein
MMPSMALPRTLAEITPPWLTWALRTGGYLARANIVAIAGQAIGQEVGFLDGLARLHLTYDHDEPGAPASVVVKMPSQEAAYRQIGDRYHAAGPRGVALADAQIQRFFLAALELEAESVLPK